MSKVRMADIYVGTRQYRFAHGHDPRGAGHWAFEFRGMEGREVRFYDGTYSEAKRQAMRDAKAAGVVDIQVMS